MLKKKLMKLVNILMNMKNYNKEAEIIKIYDKNNHKNKWFRINKINNNKIYVKYNLKIENILIKKKYKIRFYKI